MDDRNIVRVVIADDHPIFREGVKRLLDAERGFHVVGEAADGGEALRVTGEMRPDVLLLDLTMPRGSGLDVLRGLAKEPAVRVVVLTAGIDQDAVVSAVQLGARGVLLKESATTLLFECLGAVMADQYWLGAQDVAAVVKTMRRATAQAEADGRKKRNRYGLTPRELEIVGGVVMGESNKEIAGRFSVREDTIKHHMSNIFDKLGVFSRLELAVFAINHGVVEGYDHMESRSSIAQSA